MHVQLINTEILFKKGKLKITDSLKEVIFAGMKVFLNLWYD